MRIGTLGGLLTSVAPDPRSALKVDFDCLLVACKHAGFWEACDEGRRRSSSQGWTKVSSGTVLAVSLSPAAIQDNCCVVCSL